ncbi:hypothetical protein AC579_1074 [Pseudocercospora musae]|uniref:Chromo domain-containing protein n=1 Tax=Pseudocercospora musae TaxID=113226 RepID=A0A139H717_9PEZI|nr:hypothetical protein AC579_1074 [Pseudocercospora musae]
MVSFEDGHVEHVSSTTESEAEPSVVQLRSRKRTSWAARMTERPGHARGSGLNEEDETETESASGIESAHESQEGRGYSSGGESGGDFEEESADSREESGYSSGDESGGDSEGSRCEVSAILDSRYNRKAAVTEYKVQWEGYEDELPTWESSNNFINAAAMVNAFHKSRPSNAAKSHAHTTCSKAVATEAEDDEQHCSESLESVGSDAGHTSDEDSDRQRGSDGNRSEQEDWKSLGNTLPSQNGQSSSSGAKARSTASVNKATTGKLHHSKKVTFAQSDSALLSQRQDPLRNQRISQEAPETRKRKEDRLRYVKSQAATKTYTVRFSDSSGRDPSLFSGTFVRIPSSGVGLLCGADAVYNLLKPQFSDITKASVVSTIRGLVSDYGEFQLSEKEQGDSDLRSPANRNFFHDQLAAGLAHFGNYVLGVVVIGRRREGGHEVFLEDQRPEKKGKGEVKWVMWEKEHWEALVPAASVMEKRHVGCPVGADRRALGWAGHLFSCSEELHWSMSTSAAMDTMDNTEAHLPSPPPLPAPVHPLQDYLDQIRRYLDSATYADQAIVTETSEWYSAAAEENIQSDIEDQLIDVFKTASRNLDSSDSQSQAEKAFLLGIGFAEDEVEAALLTSSRQSKTRERQEEDKAARWQDADMDTLQDQQLAFWRGGFPPSIYSWLDLVRVVLAPA